MKHSGEIFLACLSVMSLFTFVLYAADKRKAQKGQWRIKEATLLWAGFFGGAAGALLAMRKFRHKTKHKYFWVINYLCLFAQIALLLYLVI